MIDENFEKEVQLRRLQNSKDKIEQAIKKLQIAQDTLRNGYIDAASKKLDNSFEKEKNKLNEAINIINEMINAL